MLKSFIQVVISPYNLRNLYLAISQVYGVDKLPLDVVPRLEELQYMLQMSVLCIRGGIKRFLNVF